MPEGWKFRELGRPGSERRDKEFLSREGFVFRFSSFCWCFVFGVVVAVVCCVILMTWQCEKG